ncbi:MAG: hypothetical protein EOP51_03905 [Sphingobacteriales bacterium]|nr:MAG: hypothetical protein EOP51_03905 [Sphingobacteriales bacterium]
MWKKPEFKQKKIFIISSFLLTILICYKLSFTQAFEAIRLNRDLHEQKRDAEQLDINYPQIERKNQFYTDVLKRYSVASDDHENKIWQTLSGIALSKNVKITFDPSSSSQQDTTSALRFFNRHNFNFKGDYFNCVSLLDSICRTKETGIITNITLALPKESTEKEGEISLKLNLITRLK